MNRIILSHATLQNNNSAMNKDSIYLCLKNVQSSLNVTGHSTYISYRRVLWTVHSLTPYSLFSIKSSNALPSLQSMTMMHITLQCRHYLYEKFWKKTFLFLMKHLHLTMHLMVHLCLTFAFTENGSVINPHPCMVTCMPLWCSDKMQNNSFG